MTEVILCPGMRITHYEGTVWEVLPEAEWHDAPQGHVIAETVVSGTTLASNGRVQWPIGYRVYLSSSLTIGGFFTLAESTLASWVREVRRKAGMV